MEFKKKNNLHKFLSAITQSTNLLYIIYRIFIPLFNAEPKPTYSGHSIFYHITGELYQTLNKNKITITNFLNVNLADMVFSTHSSAKPINS